MDETRASGGSGKKQAFVSIDLEDWTSDVEEDLVAGCAELKLYELDLDCDPTSLAALLHRLAALPVDLEMLRRTGCGKATNQRWLQHNSDENVRIAGQELLRVWKAAAGVAKPAGIKTSAPQLRPHSASQFLASLKKQTEAPPISVSASLETASTLEECPQRVLGGRGGSSSSREWQRERGQARPPRAKDQSGSEHSLQLEIHHDMLARKATKQLLQKKLMCAGANWKEATDWASALEECFWGVVVAAAAGSCVSPSSAYAAAAAAAAADGDAARVIRLYRAEVRRLSVAFKSPSVSRDLLQRIRSGSLLVRDIIDIPPEELLPADKLARLEATRAATGPGDEILRHELPSGDDTPCQKCGKTGSVSYCVVNYWREGDLLTEEKQESRRYRCQACLEEWVAEV